MDIYIYSDESGVFDYIHNEYFVFGGLIFLSKQEKDNQVHKYANVEKTIRNSLNFNRYTELKASFLAPKYKNKIFRSLNNCRKFAVIVNQKRINESIFNNKKSKQRYLDYAYKIGVKNALQELISKGLIIPNEVENIYFNVDEHTTATNGRYELREALENEFKWGTFNYDYQTHFPPIFPNMLNVNLNYSNSEKVRMIRASDIIANYIYKLINDSTNGTINKDLNNISIKYLP